MDPVGEPGSAPHDPGNAERSEAEPPPQLPQPRAAALRDGTPVVIGPLLPADRQALALGYAGLSDESRRRRFFSAPEKLSESLLDYLTDLDFDQRFAWVARLRDDPEEQGLGVARWVRLRDDPSKADAAVVVADAWQGRGLGTELLLALIDAATERGITTFVADVLWDNETLLGTLRRLGAHIVPAEPGVARVEFELPKSSTELAGSAVHRMLVEVAAATAP